MPLFTSLEYCYLLSDCACINVVLVTVSCKLLNCAVWLCCLLLLFVIQDNLYLSNHFAIDHTIIPLFAAESQKSQLFIAIFVAVSSDQYYYAIPFDETWEII